jgi:Protein of unknown function (DUF1353)
MASTPQVLWWFVPPFGKYLFAAVVHDYLYATQYFGSGYRAWRKADNTMWRAIRHAPIKVGMVVRLAIHLGLFFGGWVAYRNYGKELAATFRA